MEDSGKWNQFQLEWDQHIECNKKKNGKWDCWVAEMDDKLDTRQIHFMGTFSVVECSPGCKLSFDKSNNTLVIKKQETPRNRDKNALYCTARNIQGDIIEKENETPEIMQCEAVKISPI